jgi:hypothetical protein
MVAYSLALVGPFGELDIHQEYAAFIHPAIHDIRQ